MYVSFLTILIHFCWRCSRVHKQASIRDGDGNTALHLACLNDDLNTIDALLEPIKAAELKEFNQWSNQLSQPNACRKLSIDLDQRNFYGKQLLNL